MQIRQYAGELQFVAAFQWFSIAQLTNSHGLSGHCGAMLLPFSLANNSHSGTPSMFDLPKIFTKHAAGFVAAGLVCAMSTAHAGNLENEYSELSRLYNAFDVAQAQLFDVMVEINADSSTADAQNQLTIALDAMANMTMVEMIEAGLNFGDAQIVMDSPYAALETEARIALAQHVNMDHSLEDAASAFANSSALTPTAAAVISRGRALEREIYDIFTDKSSTIIAKRAQVDQAVERYLSEDELAVASEPKMVALYLSGEYANGLKAAFPKFSALMWSNQWLQLASIEAIVLGQVDPQFANEIDTTLERYRNKLGSETGMTMFPAPTEMPTVPAIAPSLYSQSPEAAVIIDNLNMLEVAVANIIAYPNVTNRAGAIDEAVRAYTDKEYGIAVTEEYLLSALRGGIFNQGGPAIGALDGSERNRSRIGMDMQKNLRMSTPNH